MKRSEISKGICFVFVTVMIFSIYALAFNVTNILVKNSKDMSLSEINRVNSSKYVMSVKGELFYNSKGYLSIIGIDN